MDFSGDKGIVRLVFSEDRIHLLFAEKDAPRDDDSAFSKDTTYLFILEEYNEKDAKGIANEIIDYMNDTFIVKKKTPIKPKDISTVSRSSVKSGLLSYDPITFATKLSGVYPELKEKIAENIDTYGEFLCEDFFVNHGNALVLETIRQNDKIKMRQLFKLLNDIYEDGTNDTQSLVAVTILGSTLAANKDLLENAQEYFSDTMKEPVTEIVNYLAKSKSARMRLENPPVYKPKKNKKKGMLSSMLGMQ